MGNNKNKSTSNITNNKKNAHIQLWPRLELLDCKLSRVRDRTASSPLIRHFYNLEEKQQQKIMD